MKKVLRKLIMVIGLGVVGVVSLGSGQEVKAIDPPAIKMGVIIDPPAYPM